jgi:mannose-1-phosphate guanylyltransferase
MNGLILCGGLATRLRPLTYTDPKILLPINNRALLDYQMDILKDAHEVILATNYLTEKIEEYIKGRYDNIIINTEKEFLGTAGAIKNAEEFLDDTFFVLNGDVISFVNLRELLNTHKKCGGVITIALCNVEDPSRYGTVNMEGKRILEFIEKKDPSIKLVKEDKNLINAGIYAVEPDFFDLVEKNKKTSIEKEIFPVLAAKKQLYGFEFDGFWSDVGVPEEYIRVNLELSNSPYVIGKNCRIIDSLIEESVIYDNVVIENSIIRKSVIADNIHIQNAIIEDTVIGENTRIIE